MKDDNREGWHRLPKMSFDKRSIKRRLRRARGATVRHAHKFIVGRWSSFRESQYNITKWIIVVGIIIAATGFQLVWYQNNYRATAPANEGTYAEAVLGPVKTLNPIFADSSAEQSASYLLFSRLMNYDKSGHLAYDAASRVSINSSKTTYTVDIRPDIMWHDGYRLTTADIAFTIGLIKNDDVRSTVGGWDGVSFKVISDTTIEFSTTSVYAAFEHLLTFPILPKHILGTIAPASVREASFSQHPVGSGPFKLNYIQNVDENSGRKVIYMVRNNNYYGGLAKSSRFQLHVYDSADDIVSALAINEVNAVADLSPIEASRIDNKKYLVTYTPIQSGVYAILNNKSQELSDINIRKALQLATDTVKLRGTLGANSPALDLPLTNTQLNGDMPKADQFDIVRAKKLLDDNGWKIGSNGFRQKDGRDLNLSIVVMSDSELEKVLSVVVAQWRELNINIDTKVVDPEDASQNVIQGVLQPRNYDVLIYRLNLGADPDVYAYWHSSQANANGLNFSNYSNQVSDDALATARARTEPDLRNAKYLTFTRQWLADVPAIGLYQTTAQYVHIKDVKSFDSTNILISSTDRYSDILNWSVGTREVYKTP